MSPAKLRLSDVGGSLLARRVGGDWIVCVMGRVGIAASFRAAWEEALGVRKN